MCVWAGSPLVQYLNCTTVRMVDLNHFAGLIFVDARTHAHYVLYNQAYFTGLIFAVRRSPAKTVKIGPL